MLSLVGIIAWGGSAVQAQQVQFERYILPGNNVFPEGIAYQAATGDFFVSSTSDGTILRGNIAREQAEIYIPGGTDVLTGSRGMKVDNAGRLYICAGPQGMLFVYNTADKRLLAKLASGQPNSFLNDVSIAPDGSAYVTDSNVPAIYRASANAQGEFTMERWLDVSPTIVYTQGFNLGGIDVSDDGRYIIAAQGNTGKLFRVEVASKTVSEINLGGTLVQGADGIWLEGNTLYVMRNSARLLVTISMSADMGTGTVVSSTTHPSFGFPTTFAKVGDRLLVVNSQFDKRNSAPELPFTVSSVPAPQVAQPGTPAPTTTTGASPTTVAASPTTAVSPTTVPTIPPTPEIAPPLPPAITAEPQATTVPVPGMPTTGSNSAWVISLVTILIALLLTLSGGVILSRNSRRG
jgi:Cu-Zn family superoxide dismutase